jgi:hypothetical protein
MAEADRQPGQQPGSTDDWAADLMQPAAQVVPLRLDQSAWAGR